MMTMLSTALWLFLAVRTVGGLWIVWRNLRQALRELPYLPSLPWLELLHQSLKLLVWATASVCALVEFAQQRQFAMLFIAGVIWLCLLQGFIQERMKTKESGAGA
jgi:hypothetical protein